MVLRWRTFRSTTSLFFASSSCFIFSVSDGAGAASDFASVCWGASVFFSASVDCHLRAIRGGTNDVARGSVDIIEENGECCIRWLWAKEFEEASAWRRTCLRIMIVKLFNYEGKQVDQDDRKMRQRCTRARKAMLLTAPKISRGSSATDSPMTWQQEQG